MAKLQDIPVVWRRVGPLRFVQRVWREINDDNLFTWGAALAYSWLFAIFPFLIFLLTLVPHLPRNVIDEATVQIPKLLWTWLPDQAATPLWSNIQGVLTRPQTGLLSIGLFVTIWAASGGVNMTMTALDRCYEIDRGRSFVNRRLMAIFITVIVASLILAVLVLIPIGNIVTKFVLNYWEEKQFYFPQWILWAWNIARYSLAGVLLFTVVSVTYHFGISVKQRFHVLSPGSVFTIAVWILLGVGFRWYVNSFGKDNYNKTYGTVGGVAVLLLFFYLDALVLMIGAEINAEIDYEVMGVERGCRDFRFCRPADLGEQSQPSAPVVHVKGQDMGAASGS